MTAMRPVPSTGFVSASLVLFLSLLLPTIAPATPEAADAGPFQLTIFHTNDIHGGFAVRPLNGDGEPVGGFAALAGHLARERQHVERSLLLDAGDMMTGNPICELAPDGVRGGAMAALMNAVGYDAGTVGNHEFDLGRAGVRALAEACGFPLLAADLEDSQTGELLVRPGPIVLERDGLRVGVMGVSCARLSHVCTPGRLDGVVSRSQESRLREQLADLVGRTDVQVLISHNGVQTDRRLAKALGPDGLDVIVGGHSHTRLSEPALEAGVIVVQAGSKLRRLGRLDLRIADGRVTHYRGRLVLLTADAVSDAPVAVRDLVDDHVRTVQTVYGREIGTLAADLRRSSRRESPLGDWLCDVLRDHAGSDVCLVNSGGIRKALVAGPLTRLDLHEVLPFGNTLVVHTMSGASLRAILEANAAAAENHTYGILQVSGVRYTRRADVLVEATVRGAPLDDAGVYTVAMPDYVATMADTYLAGADLGPIRETGESLTDIMIAAVAGTTAPIEPPAVDRMVRLDP